MNAFSSTLKRGAFLALAAVGAIGAGVAPASAHYYTTRCDNDGDRCYRVVCDNDGDTCHRTGYGSYYGSGYYGRTYYNGYSHNYPTFSFGFSNGDYDHRDWRHYDDDDD